MGSKLKAHQYSDHMTKFHGNQKRDLIAPSCICQYGTASDDHYGLYRVGQKTQTCLSVDNSAIVTGRKACYMSKALDIVNKKRPNLHSKSFKYSLPNLHKSALPLKLGICLHSHVPAFIELKVTAKKSRFKFCYLFTVGALQQIAWSQNFSN